MASTHADSKSLIACIDACLTNDADERLQGLSTLAAHPDSRNSRIVVYLARRLLFDDDRTVADEAIGVLARLVGRARWSWKPNDANERAIVDYGAGLCRDFSESECRRLVERADGEQFCGPSAMGERIYDLLVCCERSRSVLEEIAAAADQPMKRRENALYMIYECDHKALSESWELAHDPVLGDVYRAMYPKDFGRPE